MENLRKLANSDKILNLLGNLYMRWQDEKYYEDFNDYASVMKDNVEKILGCKIVKYNGTQEPFGIKFYYGEYRYHLFLKIKGNRASLNLRIVAP